MPKQWVGTLLAQLVNQTNKSSSNCIHENQLLNDLISLNRVVFASSFGLLLVLWLLFVSSIQHCHLFHCDWWTHHIPMHAPMTHYRQTHYCNISITANSKLTNQVHLDKQAFSLLPGLYYHFFQNLLVWHYIQPMREMHNVVINLLMQVPLDKSY